VTGPRSDEELVSVLVATKDRLHWLRDCLQSARDQTYARLEIVVSDDGSRDGTVEYVRSVAAVDQRVRLLTDNPSPGVFGNFAHLLKHAEGQAVCLVSDDDLLGPTFVEELTRGLRHPSVGVAYAGFDVIDGDGVPRPDVTALLERHHGFTETPAGLEPDGVLVALRGQLWLGSCLYRTNLIRSLGFDPSCGSAADWDLALRAVDLTSVWYVPRRLWSYRDHGATISRTRQQEGLRSAITVLERRSYAQPAPEDLRQRLLRRYLLRTARREVASRPDQSRCDLREYRERGGSRLALRYLVIAALSRLPGPIRRPVVRVLSASRD
jgi:glycosyltransferase involved in cell wall biosynthesis